MVAFEDLDLPAVVAMPSWSQSFSARPLAVAVTDRLSRIRTNYDNRLRIGIGPGTQRAIGLCGSQIFSRPAAA